VHHLVFVCFKDHEQVTGTGHRTQQRVSFASSKTRRTGAFYRHQTEEGWSDEAEAMEGDDRKERCCWGVELVNEDAKTGGHKNVFTRVYPPPPKEGDFTPNKPPTIFMPMATKIEKPTAKWATDAGPLSPFS
jgi:hypothetical protein